MREEYQKTIILLSIILIFGGVYVSTFFDRGSNRQNNSILFAILIAVTMLGYLQTYKIKRWKEEEKTDYRLVYWSYLTLTCILFFYMIYMIMSRSEKEYIRVVRVMVSNGAIKIYHFGQDSLKARNKRKRNFKGGSYSHLDTEVSNNNELLADNNSSYVDNIGTGEEISSGNYSGKENRFNISNKEIMERMTVSGTMSKLFQGYKKIWKKIFFIKD